MKKRIGLLLIVFVFASILLLCASCDLSNKDDCSHNYSEWTVTTESTCSAKGVQTRTCAKCGKSIEKEMEMKSHSYGEEVTAKAASCANTGEVAQTCSVCAHVKTTYLPKLEHEFVRNDNGGIATFTNDHVCGSERKTWKECSACKEKVYINTTVKYYWTHSWGDFVTDTPASCTEDGQKSRHCEYCDSKSEITVILAGHQYIVTDSKRATCTEAGYSKFKCTICENEITTDISAAGHDFYTYEITIPATCQTSGTKTSTCTRTGCDVTDTIDIPISDTHNWGNWIVTNNGDCKNSIQGERTRTCPDCGTTENSPHPYVHDFDPHLLKCTECSAEYTENADKIFTYQNYGSSGNIRITGYTGNGASVIRIPSEIDGKTVVAIYQRVFTNRTELEYIWLPDTLTEIGIGAFSGCTSLKELYIPRTVTSLGESILTNCISLERLVLPFISSRRLPSDPNYDSRSLKTLGSYFGTNEGNGLVKTTQLKYGATTGNTDIDYYIPLSLKTLYVHGGYIGEEALRNCTNLENVYVGSMCVKQTNGTDYVSYDGASVSPQTNCNAKIDTVTFKGEMNKIYVSIFYPQSA